MSTNRRRVKIGATLDPDLVAAVDLHVARTPGTDRSAVIDDALRLWSERQQEVAMERQLRADAAHAGDERLDWRRVRGATARRRLERPKPS
jgi:Arc/MetJ-type ribon-helix-helix transcriptional regulator